ncbi:MAG: hypothetical protein LAT51_12500 [Flavobacteriaceae bacterium]|nr:hypothetical protein [Flavobacteriaceae bacterium]
MMNKFEFIEGLLANRQLTQLQRDRLMRLALKELNIDSDLENRLKKLEESLLSKTFLANNINVLNENRPTYLKQKVEFKRKHLPKEMVKFLYKFSSEDRFKWFTHEPDLKIEQINYLYLLDQIKRKLYYPDLNYSTTGLINNFLFKNEVEIYYPQQKINLTYGSKAIQERLEKGENPFKIKVEDTYFKNVIETFKCAIEFRIDYGEKLKFSYLIKDFFLTHLSLDFTDSYTDRFNKIGKSINTFIDTNNFFAGMGKIIKWINHYKSLSTELEIDLADNDDNYMLTVFHKNSYISKDVAHQKLKGISGDFEILRKYWFSIVDFEIQADFKKNGKIKPYSISSLDNNTFMRIVSSNYVLSENSITPINDKIKVDGVKYLVKIYKTKNL